MSDNSLTVARSCDLGDLCLTIKVASFQGLREKKPLANLDAASLLSGLQLPGLSDLYVVFQLWADSCPLTPPYRTAHKSFSSTYAWNEVFILPVKFKELPLNAQLTFTVYDSRGPPSATSACPVGGTTLKLFGKKATLKRGKQRLYLWKDRIADGAMHSSTPSKVELNEADELGRLEKLVKKHQSGDIPRVDWLDKLAFRQIERIHALETAKSKHFYLYVDLPSFDFPVVYSEQEYHPPVLPAPIASTSSAAISSSFTNTNLTTPTQLSEAAYFAVIDPDAFKENLVEAKHRRLVRGHRTTPLDRELKPDPKIRDELNEILRYPPTQHLTSQQRDLIWRYRFYLSRDKRTLTKFLKSVVWSDPGEVAQAVEELLPSWTDIEMEDALELLGPGEAFRDKRVRAYAVKQISRVDDEELMLYLLQLVQALKFDTAPTHSSSRHRKKRDAELRGSSIVTLEDFLVDRSVKNAVLGNHLYWYLMCEMEDETVGKLFRKVAFNFMTKIEEKPNGAARRDEIKRQAEFTAAISKLARDLRLSKDARPKKIEKMKSAINDKLSLASFQPIPLPLDARIMICGIDTEHSTIFKSNLFPLRLQLKTVDPSTSTGQGDYSLILKNGDDLRQDQLVLQLFTLMDRLLRKENLDLKMTPYKVLATTPLDGMIQFVPSQTIGSIASEYAGSLLAYLRQHNPDEGSVSTFGVKAEVLDTFVRSCAGYCVVTYLLGVGDRHLDNLLLSPDGHFFHVDFGYILGRDPKIGAPAVKLSKEMSDALGGFQSPHFNRFKNLCFTAFASLRKSANLIINLISLMVDASIPDIKLEPDKAVMKVQDKFRLDLSEEDAILYLEGVLNETSTWATVLDRLHSAAQAFRA